MTTSALIKDSESSVEQPIIVVETRIKESSDINAENNEMEQYFQNIRNGDNALLKECLFNLEAYSDAMKPGKLVEPDVGAQKQRELFNIIRRITKLPSDKFRSAWVLLLNFANTNDVFKERYIYRFSEYWAWDQDQLSAFQRVINFILLTKDHKTRSTNMKQVSILRTFQHPFTQEETQNINSFYS